MGVVLFGLSACGPINTGYDTLQFNGDAIPFPEGYQVDAANAVSGMAVKGPLQVSHPKQIAGESVFDPRRWYVCVFGLDPAGAGSLPPGLVDWLTDTVLHPPKATGVFELVLVFSRYGTPTVLRTFDSPLCRDVVVEDLHG